MKSLVDQQKKYFNGNTTKSVAFRIAQLEKLRTCIKKYEWALTDAIFKDFQKGTFNTFLTEFSSVYMDLGEAIKNVGKWAKAKRVNTNILNSPASSHIMPEPMGTCLIIGAWNYPINLVLVPAIAAIAAGNTVIVKPSELTPHTNGVLAQMIAENFENSFIAVVEGGVEKTAELLEQQFDKIFFTGSVSVGRIVYLAAAKNLTPVTLELGGKCPLIVSPDTNLKICVKRLVWGKFLNAGQTCIAPDHAFVHKDIEKPFLAMLKKEIEGAKFSLGNQNYAQIINEKHFDRLINLIEPGKVFTGGEYDRASRFLQPTIMTGVSVDDKVMEEEIFGPILPVLTYNDLDNVIAYIKSKPKPLALYLFTESSEVRTKVLQEVSFGGGAVNEILMQFSNNALPFGGVGDSGMGNYHGEAGFKSFSHYKSIMQKPTWFELPLKYYPYKGWKFSMIKRVMGL